ncbi:YitT family protein [Clostridium hydrogeniformans]|uniref:YitT family protein n=1 Tax=Clostridium hydrogeniformans TaxID=349933 RepID=UPI00068A3E6F|nr:YitT family protein [Clostridium hydrogeniformans]
MSKNFKDYLFIVIGVLCVASGLYFFMMPNNIAGGGINGIAMVLNHYIPMIPVGGAMFIIDGILFIVAFVIIGPGFGAKTIFSSLLLSSTIFILEKVVPLSGSITGDIFLEMLFGIMLTAIGMAIIFNANASTGGTDIIAKILNKYFHINMGKGVLFTDLVVVILAIGAFGLKSGLYALFAVVLNGMVIDRAIDGLNAVKEIRIISNKIPEIEKFILEELERGATIYHATGSYSKSQVDVLSVIVDRKEFIRIKNYIKEVDPKAFVSVTDVYEALGDGFKKII